MALRHVEGPDQQSLTFAEVMEALGVSKGTLRSMIDRGVFPAGVPLGGTGAFRWPWLDIVAFLHLSARLAKPPQPLSENEESEEKIRGHRRPLESK